MSARTKMTSGQTRETKIPVVDSLEKVSSNVIECSVNMNVSLSRAKKSQIFQRAQTLFIVIIAVVFAIVFFRLKREVQALEVQVTYIVFFVDVVVVVVVFFSIRRVSIRTCRWDPFYQNAYGHLLCVGEKSAASPCAT